MTDDFDLVDRAPFDVVEHRAVKGHRFRGQFIAPEDEIEAKVMGQNRLRGDGPAKNHRDIAPTFLDRLTLPARDSAAAYD